MVLKTIHKLWKSECELLLRELANRDGLILSGDCGWAHRRHSNQGAYTLIEWETEKIICRKVLCKSRTKFVNGTVKVVFQGNHDATSHSMECTAFSKCMDKLADFGVLPKVKYFVVDEDVSVLHLFQSQARLQHITVLHDPGHVKNNFEKQLVVVFGTSEAYKGFPARLARWLMQCLKRAEEEARKQVGKSQIDLIPVMQRIFLELWDKTLGHYTRRVRQIVRTSNFIILGLFAISSVSMLVCCHSRNEIHIP